MEEKNDEELQEERNEEMEEVSDEEQFAFDGLAMEKVEDDGERVDYHWVAHYAPKMTNSSRFFALMEAHLETGKHSTCTCKL